MDGDGFASPPSPPPPPPVSARRGLLSALYRQTPGLVINKAATNQTDAQVHPSRVGGKKKDVLGKKKKKKKSLSKKRESSRVEKKIKADGNCNLVNSPSPLRAGGFMHLRTAHFCLHSPLSLSLSLSLSFSLSLSLSLSAHGHRRRRRKNSLPYVPCQTLLLSSPRSTTQNHRQGKGREKKDKGNFFKELKF